LKNSTNFLCRLDYATQRPTRPPPYPESPSIVVKISSPTLQIVEVGETIRLSCNGYSVVDRVRALKLILIQNRKKLKFIYLQIPLTIRWYKMNGRLSDRTYVDSGTLTITNTQVDDSGVYVCQAQRGQETVQEKVTVTVGGK